MKLLTDPMTLSPPAALEALLPKLKPVTSYFGGVGGEASPPLPGLILCFPRLSGRELGSGLHRSSHHRYVCIVALKGEGTVCVDAANHRLRPGTAILLLPYQYHSYTDTDRDLRWLFITFEAASGQWAGLGNTVHRLASVEWSLVEEIARCWQATRRQRLLPWHVGLLLERIAARPGQRQPPTEVEADLLVRVNQYALPRLNQALPVEEVAAALGISGSHLRAEFRRTTGFALGGHLRHLRLQRACALLHTTSHSISQIAEACGFESVYSFSRAFKAKHHLSPRKYRQLHF